MKEWLEQFYTDPQTRAALLAIMAPLFDRYASAIAVAEGVPVSPAFVDAMAASFVNSYLDSSRAQLQTVYDDAGYEGISGRLDEWAEKRAGKVAMEETVRFPNAVAETQFRDRGVQRKVWRSHGETCDYCTSMDGTEVPIDKPFFTNGSVFQPKGVDKPLTFSTSVGHPPAHPGCDCSIEPG